MFWKKAFFKMPLIFLEGVMKKLLKAGIASFLIAVSGMAFSPISERLSGKNMLVRFEQSSKAKASFPMEVTPSGIVMLSRLGQL